MDGGQLVDRDVEEALDLALVQVHRQDPVGAGDGDHVGDEPGRDRDARLVLLVRPAVGVERDDRRDPAGAGALERVDHDQQFHDRLVDRVAGRLDEEDVLLADVLEDLDEDVLVGELEDLQLARLGAEIAADLPGEVRVRVAVVDLELVRVQARRLPSAERREGRHTDLIRLSPDGGLGAGARAVRSGVAIVAHAVLLRKSGAERGDGHDPVALGQAHDDDAAGAAGSSG